ncbi:MAG: hypothetical protein JWL83_3860, partial [Actinomycetia bacterium]|nr:hypothetical protein [Actinomycetes bacterium]
RTVAAATPEAAIAHFLDARVRGNLDDAWRVVSDRDRRQFPAAVDFVDANGELPRVVKYRLGAPSISGGRAHVPGTVSFVASLDQVGGDVPARATAAWTAVRERGTWHVLLAESEIHPQFPSAAGARPAALAWASARQRCTTGPQWQGPLLGSDAETRAARLCHTPGAVQVGAPRELDPNDGSDSFLAAFGGDVFTWARVVPLTSPVSVDIVLAPIGDQWSVIGAMQASPASSG